MAVAAETHTPSNHLPLEPTGLTPSFGGTPGFFSAEFGNLNPFDVDFHNATQSPLQASTPYSPDILRPDILRPSNADIRSSSIDVPRPVEAAMRRNYDPSLVPTPGPRVGLTPFKSSSLKEVTVLPALPPSPRHSPTLNPALLEKKPSKFALPPMVHEFTPPTDESGAEEKGARTKNKANGTKRKSESGNERDGEDDAEHTNNNNNNGGTNKNREENSESIGGNLEGAEDGNKEPDTKRKKFLERNRLAASKCRQKKKAWASNLEEQARYQSHENKILHASIAQLRDEYLYLKNFLLSTHSGCNCVGVKNYLLKEAQISQVAGVPILAAAGRDPRAYPHQVMIHPLEPRVDRARSVSIANGVSDGRGGDLASRQ